MTEYKCILYGFLIALSFSCQHQNINGKWKDYYIPQQLKSGPVVLEYLATVQGNTIKSFVYLNLEEDELTSYYLSPNMRFTQKVKEEFTASGSKIKEYIIYEDSTGINCNIERGDIFSFQELEPQAFTRYKVEWVSKKDSTINSVSKARMFKETTKECYKDNCDALIFELKELIINSKAGAYEYEATTEEYYYKNLGLIKSKKVINNQHEIEYLLQYIYEKNAFESKYGIQLP